MKLVNFSLLYPAAVVFGQDIVPTSENFESIIREALSKVYTPTETGCTLSIEPYFSGEIFYKNSLNLGFEGTIGQGIEVKSLYNVDTCELITEKDGSVNAFPGYNYIFPEHTWNYEFYAKQKMNLCIMQNQEITYSVEGNVNDESFSGEVSLSLDSFQRTNKKMGATIVFQGKSEFSENFPEMIKPQNIPSQFSFEISPSAKTVCEENVMDNKCSAEVVVESVVNDAELPTTKISWKAKSGVFQVRYGSENVFKLKIKYAKYWKISYSCKDLICGKFADGWYVSDRMVHLITVPSDKAIPDITDAVFELAAVWMSLYKEAMNSYSLGWAKNGQGYERLAHFMVYFDHFGNVLADEKDAFDCSEIVEATGFEWPWLAAYYGFGTTVQEFGKSKCQEFNANAEHSLKVRAPIYVQSGRQFMRNVLNEDAEESFKSWTLELLA